MSRLTVQDDYDEAVITLSNLHDCLRQLEVDFIDNANIMRKEYIQVRKVYIFTKRQE